jgi:hypothetical protein
MDASSGAVMFEKFGSFEFFLQNAIRDCVSICLHSNSDTDIGIHEFPAFHETLWYFLSH